jgi:release factor glutamine methyltransferase
LIDQRYAYSDDSQLMAVALSQLEQGESFLEIGVGNGGNQRIVAGKFSLVVGTDIIDLREIKQYNPASEFIIADRATCFRNSVFDVVAFNPPYVPSETIIDKTVDGGPNGIEVPLEFLRSAVEAVKKSGKILILLSSDDAMPIFQEFCMKNNLNSKKIAEKKLFFETLAIFEITMSIV